MKNLQNCPSKNKSTLLLVLFLISLFCHNDFAQKDQISVHSSRLDFQPNLPFRFCWSYQTGIKVTSIVASDNSELTSINFLGETQWKTELGGQTISNLLIIGDNIFLASKPIDVEPSNVTVSETGENLSRKPNTIRSINRFTGVTNWLMKIFDSEKIHLSGYDDNIIVIGREGIIKSIKANNGQIVWEDRFSSELSSEPYIENTQTVLVGTTDGYIIRRSLNSGRQIRKMKVTTAPTAVLTDQYQQNLFWGDAKGSVFSVKNTDPGINPVKYKSRWQFRNGASISHLVATSNGLLISSYDNFVYFISYEDGEIIWKRRFAGRIDLAPFIGGTYAVILTTVDSDAVVIEMSSGKQVNKISLKDVNLFTNSPTKIGNQLLFPTLNGIFSFSTGICPNN